MRSSLLMVFLHCGGASIGGLCSESCVLYYLVYIGRYPEH